MPRAVLMLPWFSVPLISGPVLCCVAALGVFGCESTAGEDDAERETRGNVRLQDEHNYRSMSSLSIPAVETASEADLEICWSEVMSDLQCHGLDPQDDVDTVALLRFLHLSEAEVEAELTADQVMQSELDGYLEYLTDHGSTCTDLSSMTFFGTPIEIDEEYAESEDHTYLLLFSEGTTPGVGARSMIFLRPRSDSSNTNVDGQEGCGLLDFSAELSDDRVRIPAQGPWVVDWRDVTRDGQGLEIAAERIDGVLLGFFEGQTVSEIEAQILDLELIATELFEIELDGGRTADLARAEARDDDATFSGFDREEDGVWLLGLMCSTCQNPAPIVLSVLEPFEEDD